MIRASRLSAFVLAAGLMGSLCSTAQAARIIVDFDGGSFDTTGENFALGDSVFGAGKTGTVPFALDFGAGAASYDFCFNANGFVSFVTTGIACNFTAAPAGDYIAAFFTALNVGGNTLYSTGLLDPDSPYLPQEASPAMRFIWDATDGASNSVLAEVLLYSRPTAGAGAFGVEFRYGNDFIDGAPATGQQGFSLGNNVLGPTSGPFSSDTDYVSTFQGGTCGSTCGGEPPVDVSEPGMLAMIGGAFLFLPFALGRRHLRRSPL